METFGEKLGLVQPGQIWSIKQAPNPEARAIIGRVEPFKGRMVLHLSVRDLAPPGGVDAFEAEAELMIGHIPIALESAVESLSSLISPAGEITPEFEQGYAEWKAAADKGQAGIFIETIPDAIWDIFAVMRTGTPEEDDA
ncbi:MAG: hypothetical protein ABWZ40_01205 [Caulobacterales bacterium]